MDRRRKSLACVKSLARMADPSEPDSGRTIGSMRRFVAIASAGIGAGGAILSTGVVLADGLAGPTPTVAGFIGWWSLDPMPWIGTVAAGAAYLIAAWKVNRGHPRVPVPTWRIAAWLMGLATILVALVSAVDRYADAFLSVHMVQHLALAMIAPPLLALGAPITLLLRVASPRARRRRILPILHSRVVSVVASPQVAWPLFTATMFLTHFSPLYDAALEDSSLHVVEHVVFLVTGALFWSPIVASDPIPHRLRYPARIVYVVLQMPVNAAVGLAIYFAPSVLYAHYATLERTWGPSARVDQQVGGAIMWGAGDLILLATVPLLVAGWMRADARRSRRDDARRVAAATYRT